MERQTGCPKHGIHEIKKYLNDYVCYHSEGVGICGYKLSKVETANYIQIKSEEALEKIEQSKNGMALEKPKDHKEYTMKGEMKVSYQKIVELPEGIPLREFKNNLEIKSWYLIDKFFEGECQLDKAKMAILALSLLIKEKQILRT